MKPRLEAQVAGGSGLCGCMYRFTWESVCPFAATADPDFGPSIRMTEADGDAVTVALKYGRLGKKEQSWVQVRGSELASGCLQFGPFPRAR